MDVSRNTSAAAGALKATAPEDGNADRSGSSPEMGNPLTIGVMRRATHAPSANPNRLESMPAPLRSGVTSWLSVEEALLLMSVSRTLAASTETDPRLQHYREIGLLSSEIVQAIRAIQSRLDALQTGSVLQPAQREPVHFSALHRILSTRALHRAQESNPNAIAAHDLRHDKNVNLSALLYSDETLESICMQSVLALRKQRPPDAARLGYSQLCRCIELGMAQEVARFIDEFLAIPSHWLATPRKVDWLRQAKGARSTIAYFAQFPNALKTENDRGQCEAVRAYAKSVVGSPFLSVEDKHALLVNVMIVVPNAPAKPHVAHCQLARVAMLNGNPAYAAALLLGICESAAQPEVTAQLLGSIAQPWPGGLPACVDEVSRALQALRTNAPQWVDEWQESLDQALQARSMPIGAPPHRR